MATDRPAEQRVQSVRNAWINALRAETLRIANRDQARVAQVGYWIATYADADGGNAWPSRETLAVLCGCTTETVTRAVAVLVAVGILARRRRPNAPQTYQLLMPTGQRLDWAAHMPLFTETRQKRAHAAKKAREMKELLTGTASVDAIRTASVDCVPDSVRGGGSGQRPWTPSEDPDSVHGRSRTASVDAIRTASVAGGTSTPTSGRDPLHHHDAADLPPQPQVHAGARPANDQSADTTPAVSGWVSCTVCGRHMLPRPGRSDRHPGCIPEAA
jgi:MYXO-CTERM domain-containing protein